MFDVPGMHVLAVRVDDFDRLELTVETDVVEHGCPTCGVLAGSQGRRVHVVHDAPCFGRPTVVRWLKRIWQCREPACQRNTFSEAHPLVPPTGTSRPKPGPWPA